MPSASVIASMDLISPPILASCNPGMSTDANVAHPEVLPPSCSLVPIHHMQSFRGYLGTIPFDFIDYQPPVFGRGLESEGDVRLFLEAAAVLTCWPIAVSMVPTARTVDYALRSEKSLENRNRPDVSIFENSSPGSDAILRGLVAIEFKGPNALDFCHNGVPTGDCDAWEYVTAQARKYAIDNHFKHIVVMDGVYGIYLGFRDPLDIEASVDIVMVNVSGGPVGFPYQVTARELILFAFYQSLNTASARRDFSGVTVPAGTGTDYADISPAAVVPHMRPQRPQVSPQTAQRRSARHLTYMQLPPGQFPTCQIESCDLTPFKGEDSGFLGGRRIPNSFFLVQATSRRVTLDVGMTRGRLLMPDPDHRRAKTPPPATSNVVAKGFTLFEILKAHQEATAYSTLKELQGYSIPFCYGVYAVDTGGVAMLFEKITGESLNDRLWKTSSVEPVDIGKVKSLFLSCRVTMERLHEAGVAHHDISGENIMLLENGDAIFIDLENVLPINNLGRKHDYRCLRLSFSQFGIEEAVLRSWC